MEFKKLLIVIPTRNRVDFAIRAIGSVLAQKDSESELLVSDNSTEEHEVEKLSAFCASCGDDRVRYVRPPKPLPMTEHWDWIMEQVIQITTVSHFIYLADRSIFKQNSLDKLKKVIKLYPEKVISYLVDEIYDDINPVILRQSSWTGKVFEVESSHMLETLTSKMVPIFSFPRMLNCCVPKSTLQTIKSTFGRYFSSVSPDYNFGFSFCAVFNSVLYYDAPLILAYGLDKSNGNNSTKGRFQKDVKDFQSYLGDKFQLSFKTPADTILIFINAVLHEYFIIKNNAANTKTKFSDINEWMYFRTLIGWILAVENVKLKKHLLTQFYKNLGVKAAAFHLRAKFPVKKWLTNPFAQENDVANKEPFILKTPFHNRDEAFKYDNDFPRKKSTAFDYLSLKLGVDKADNQNVKIIM